MVSRRQSGRSSCWYSVLLFPCHESSSILLACLAASLLIACQPEDQATPLPRSKASSPQDVRAVRSALVGTWYGEGKLATGGNRMWVMRRYGDGTFRITFRTRGSREDGPDRDETGEWGVTGQLLLTLTTSVEDRDGKARPVSAADSYYWDAYHIVKFDGTNLDYRSEEDDVLYHTGKVADDFQFPAGA